MMTLQDRRLTLTQAVLHSITSVRSAFTLLCIVCALITWRVQAQESIHTYAEILKIMEESQLVYEIGIDYEPPDSVEQPTVLSNQFYVVNHEDGSITLHRYEITESANAILDSGEVAFNKGDTQEARALYQNLLRGEPDYHFALTLIGDTFYLEGAYDSARTYFMKAIARNRVDYSAWWFLADTYGKLDMADSALSCMTIAHLLNINHSNMKKMLVKYRERAGLSWKEWSLAPVYSLAEAGRNIRISSTEEWLAYAMVKAVWKYEPGYVQRMMGADSTQTDMILEEKEAIVLYAFTNKREDLIGTFENRQGDSMVLYELVARRIPHVMLLLPASQFEHVMDYVKSYH